MFRAPIVNFKGAHKKGLPELIPGGLAKQMNHILCGTHWWINFIQHSFVSYWLLFRATKLYNRCIYTATKNGWFSHILVIRR